MTNMHSVTLVSIKPSVNEFHYHHHHSIWPDSVVSASMSHESLPKPSRNLAIVAHLLLRASLHRKNGTFQLARSTGRAGKRSSSVRVFGINAAFGSFVNWPLDRPSAAQAHTLAAEGKTHEVQLEWHLCGCLVWIPNWHC